VTRGEPEIAVRIDDARWRHVPRAAAIARRAARAALYACGARYRKTETSVVLASDAAVARLNTQWRKKRGPTDVLSFPAEDRSRRRGSPALLGDVVVAYGVAARDARAADKPLGHHLCHLVVHGTLHLAGYDHQTDHDAERMEALERTILGTLGLPDPYRDA